MKMKEVSRADIERRIERDVSHWLNEYTEPMPLKILGQRYGKQCRKLGLDLTEVISTNPVLVMRTNKSGGRLVCSSSELNLLFNDDARAVFNFWNAAGVKI